MSHWEIILPDRTMFFRQNGTAKFFSPLSVDDFIKKSSIISYSENALRAIHEDIEAFATAEHLTAHANSIKVRFEK